MDRSSRIFVAGHKGLVGSSVVRSLERAGHSGILAAGREHLDLSDRPAVDGWFEANRPEYVFLCAAKVGGILANERFPADFIRENIQIQTNVIDASWRAGVKRLLFLGSSCIYPKFAPQPMREEHLLTGPLEPTNRPYAIAKIAGIEMCWSYNRQYGTRFLSVMPTNLYGPGDNYHPENSHVIPALIRRFTEARRAGAESVTIWGTGTPRREFLYSDDMADACVFLMNLDDEQYDQLTGVDDGQSRAPLINIGFGSDVTILELAQKVAMAAGFDGEIRLDPSKPDGTPRKLLDSRRLSALGWSPSIELEEGLARAVLAFAEAEGLTASEATKG